MALPAGRYGVTKNQLLKIKKLPMNTIKLIEELTEKFDLLGTAAFKNSTSVVTDSSDLVESGAVCRAIGIDFKNLFNPTVDSVSGNITIEKNADNTYTVNGTAQVNTSYDIGTFTFKANTTYMLSGCPTGLSSEVYLRASNNDFTIQKQDKGSGVVISFDTDTTLNINIRVGTGQTLNNEVFSPMIELGSVKTAYVPYHASVSDSLAEKCDNSVIGTVEDGTNPTKAYAVGEHFIRNGKFCTCIVPVTTASNWSDSYYYVEGDVASELEYKSVTISNPATGVTISGVNAYQYGKIVNFGCILTLANNISAGTALAKISVKCKGFRLFPLYDRSTYVPVNKTVYISSADGSIVPEQALNAGEYRVYGTYFENV